MDTLTQDNLYDVIAASDIGDILRLSQTNSALRTNIRTVLSNKTRIEKLKTKIIYEAMFEFDDHLKAIKYVKYLPITDFLFTLGYDYENISQKYTKELLNYFTEKELHDLINDSDFIRLYKDKTINYKTLTSKQLVNQLSKDIPYDYNFTKNRQPPYFTIESFFPNERFYDFLGDIDENYFDAFEAYTYNFIKSLSYKNIVALLNIIITPPNIQLVSTIIKNLEKLDILLYGILPSSSDVIHVFLNALR
jgi:hypothetical protein